MYLKVILYQSFVRIVILDKGQWDWLCLWFDSIVDEILLDYNYILNVEVVIIIVWLLMMMMMWWWWW